MQVQPTFSAIQPSPRFGMTPQQQAEVREKMFDALYPHLDKAMNKVVDRHATNSGAQPNASTHAYNTIVQSMAQLSTYQEPPRFPTLFA